MIGNDLMNRIATVKVPQIRSLGGIGGEKEGLAATLAKGYQGYQAKMVKDALVSAIQGGDEAEINKAYAKVDPMGYVKNFYENKQLELKNNGKMTNDARNYEYLVGQGLSPDRARAIAFGGNTEAVGNALVSNNFNGVSGIQDLGKAGMQAYDKEMGKALAEKQAQQNELEGSISQIGNIKNRLFGNDGIVGKAQINTIVDRRIPTELLTPEAQRSRQEIQNLMGSLRLDQMQYLKGAISDKEQEFLADMVANNINKYTPAQIEGALNGILLKAQSSLAKIVNNRQAPTDDDAWGAI